MLAGLSAALAKDLRLLARDRVGLIFLTLAPIVVITVAGLSLATLYGGAPHGATRPVLAVVDEDGGWVGHAVAERLASEPSVRYRAAPGREAARALVAGKAASGALAVPAGTSEALAAGRPATLILVTDPVRTVDAALLRALTQEVRHRLDEGAVERAQVEIDATRARAEEARAALERAAGELRQRLAELAGRLEAARSEAARRAATAERELRTTLAATAADRRASARARLARELAPLATFFTELAARRQAFADWLAAARKQAGRFADRIPPPPEMPAVPPALAELAHAGPETLAARLIPPDGGPPVRLPPIEPPALPPLPAVDLPVVPAPPNARLPGPLEIEETSVTGASHFNTFDQNVPGFSVTFLLLGVLLGVSLGLLDERDWGTIERVRATPTPLAALLGAKLAARFAVGMAQMILLFAVGWIAFGVSLGPEPWALALPTVGIVFAGTAFGLIVAGVTRSREAVLPVGAIAVLTMAAVGGCWWPMDLEPEWMQRVALAFPTTWAMEAYNDLMIRRRTVGAVMPATAVLLAYGAAYLVLGLAVFRRRALR